MKYNFGKKYNYYGSGGNNDDIIEGKAKDVQDNGEESIDETPENTFTETNDGKDDLPVCGETSLKVELTQFTDNGPVITSQKDCIKSDNMEGEAAEKEDEIITTGQLPFSKPSRMETYTIKKGTILYHGSKSKETFNPFNIKLGSSNLIVFFSPDEELASRTYGSCVNFPVENGYLHKFKVSKDIENIIILSVYDLDNTDTIKKFEDRFCSRNNVYDMVLDGIGFFYPSDAQDNPKKFTSEFALCNPNAYLEYMNTQRCISRQTLGEPYKFNKA